MKNMQLTQKVWKTGSGLVIGLPKSVCQLLNIEKGDRLKITIEEVSKCQ